MNCSLIASIGSAPLLGAASALLIQQGVSKFGYSFMQFGPSNVWVVGIIGAVHQVASMFFTAVVSDKVPPKSVLLVGSSLASLGAIILTELASRADIISTRLTLFAGVMLTLASVINTVVFFALAIRAAQLKDFIN